jgi:hypothetical protein
VRRRVAHGCTSQVPSTASTAPAAASAHGRHHPASPAAYSRSAPYRPTQATDTVEICQVDEQAGDRRDVELAEDVRLAGGDTASELPNRPDDRTKLRAQQHRAGRHGPAGAPQHSDGQADAGDGNSEEGEALCRAEACESRPGYARREQDAGQRQCGSSRPPRPMEHVPNGLRAPGSTRGSAESGIGA